MNLKTLLLGSGAALMVAGGAQAADLTVAEPVDYVKVCDAFGTGYWYAPGTDTCIKIGGWVRFGVHFGDDMDFVGIDDDDDANFNDYQFRTRTSLTVTASSMTEYGPLTAFMDYRIESYGSANADAERAYLDSGWLQLGPIQAGKFTSAFDFGGGYTDDGGIRSDETTDHIQLNYALNGFGIILSVEDPQDRTEEGAYLYDGDTEDFPDLIAALTYSSGIFSGKLAGAYVDSNVEDDQGYAVIAGVEVALDSFSPGDKFKISAAYADNAPSFVGATNVTRAFDEDGISAQASGEGWNVLASYLHFWAPNLNSSITASYVDWDGDTGFDDVQAWKVAFDTAYKPVTNLTLLGEIGYQDSDFSDDASDYDGFFGLVRLQRDFP